MKKGLLILGALIVLSLVLNPTNPVQAKVKEEAQLKTYSQPALKVEPAEIQIANLNCKELSALGSGISKALELEIYQGKVKECPALRAQQLALEAKNVGGYFEGFTGPLKRFLVSIGLIKKIKPPQNVVELPIEDKIVISALAATAADWLKNLGPAGVIGSAIVKTLTPLAEEAGEELAVAGALQNIGYFEVTKPGVGKMTVIYDKESKEASVIVDLEDLEGKDLQVYGWKNESIFMYVSFETAPPKLKKNPEGGYDCKIILRAKETKAEVPPEEVPTPAPTPAPPSEALAESEHPYANNYENWWVISEPGATEIRIHFARLELADWPDRLKILDKDNKVVKTYGYAHLDMVDFWTEWYTGDTLKLKLETDSSKTAYGFLVDKVETR